MKVLYYGGAFNPPTRAHIELADYVRRQLGFDQVLFMPSKRSYITGIENKDYSFSDEERLQMLRTIAESHPWMIVSDYELTLPEQPRTYRTLCHLREHGYPELRLLIGSDWLGNLATAWKHVEEICDEFGIVVMRRSEEDLRATIDKDPFLQKIAAKLTFIDTPDTYQFASASKVRSMLDQIRDLQKQLQEAVPPELDGLKEYY